MNEWQILEHAAMAIRSVVVQLDSHGRKSTAEGREYGLIEVRRVMNGEQVAYRVTVHGEVIGWAHNLRLACHKTHVAYLAAMGNPGPPAADRGERRI